MKKDIRTLAALLIASATFVACTSDDNIIDEPQQASGDAQQTYTMTVEATKDPATTTRALTLDESGSKNTLNATWAEGEAVTVYNVTRSADLTGTLTAQSSGATTVLKGELTGTIQNGDQLKLKFLSPDYASQDGTLEYIATHCDYAEATVTVTDASTPSVTTTDASFENQQAIVRFKLMNKAGNARIYTSKLKISDGTNTYTVNRRGSGEPYYVAIPGFSGKTITMIATYGDCYKYKKTGVTFANGQYYEITVKMDTQGYVDLGLPSGTKWATCNVGAFDPEDYGDYYAWGATDTWYSSLSPLAWKTGKEAGYVTENAPYYSNGTWTKYNLNSTLQTMDDAAYVNWGSEWRMPTAEQWEELRANCTFTSTQINGVNGALVTRTGYSGELFLPAAGKFGTSLPNNPVTGFYFTASQGNYNNDSQYVLYYQFPADNTNNGNVYDTGRYFGLSIRPVRDAVIYGYTGTVQRFTAPHTGTYKLEVWGAQGGTLDTNAGGLGGYATCHTTLTQGEAIYVYVGGKGGNETHDGGAGGWNGGGKGGAGVSSFNGAGGGGGATHISKVNNQVIGSGNGQCASLVGTNFIIVAGGGGGASHKYTSAGNGGGTEGGLGTRHDGSTAEHAVHVNYTNQYYYSTSQSYGANGGNGGDGYWSAEGAGGGGGGYYGGTANVPNGTFNESNQDAGGCGGNSAYNSSFATNFSTTAGLQEGHGKAVISW